MLVGGQALNREESEIPISGLSAVERTARVLAVEKLSVNAEGYEISAARRSMPSGISTLGRQWRC
jgi:hypothetical protein